MAGLFTNKADYSGTGVFEPKTGFDENFDRQYDVVLNQGQSVSRYNAFQEGYENRVENLKELTGVELQNPYSLKNVFNLQEEIDKFEADFGEATKNLTEEERAMLVTNEKMFAQIKDRNQRTIREANFSSERASFTGKVGGFLGSTSALLLDPLQIATLPFGVGSLAGKTVLQAAGRTALTEAAIGGAVEVPIQAKVQSFQKELGVEGAGFEAGAKNVGAATLGAGVFGGIVGAGARALQLKFGKTADEMDTGELAENLRNLKNPTKEQKKLAAELSKQAQAEESNPFIGPQQPKAFKGDQPLGKPIFPKDEPLEVTADEFKGLEEARKAAEVEVEQARKAVVESESLVSKVEASSPKPKAKKEEKSLLQTITKMGGINREKAIEELGLDPIQLKGSRAFKNKGGESLDSIGMRLVEEKFLTVDEITGKYDPGELEDLIALELRGGKARRIGSDIPDDEIEAAFLRSVEEEVDPQLEEMRGRLLDAELELSRLDKKLQRAKVIQHEKNIAEADKALEEGRQPNIAENKNTQSPIAQKGVRALEEAEEMKVYDDPHGEAAAFDEQTRAYDENLREAIENPEKMGEEVPGSLEVDADGKVVPEARTFEDLAEEIEADEKFINDLAQCLR